MSVQPIHAELVCASMCTRWACHVCGGHTEKESVLCEVPKSHETHAGFRVCEKCLEDGDLDAKLLHHATTLEAQAAALRDTVGRLRVPSFADWLRMGSLLNAIYETDHSPTEALSWPLERQLATIAQYEAREALRRASRYPDATDEVPF